MSTSRDALLARLPSIVSAELLNPDITAEVMKAMEFLPRAPDTDDSGSDADSHSSGDMSASGSDSGAEDADAKPRKKGDKKKKIPTVTLKKPNNSSDDEEEPEQQDDQAKKKKKSKKKTSPSSSPKKNGGRAKKAAAKPQSDGSSGDSSGGSSPRRTRNSAAAVAKDMANEIRERTKGVFKKVTDVTGIGSTKNEFHDEDDEYAASETTAVTGFEYADDDGPRSNVGAISNRLFGP